MTTLSFVAPEALVPRETYLDARTTIRSWILTTDHKRIGVLYLVTLLFMMAAGGFFAMALRI